MTHEAFLQAILVNPDDDLPRLVYADWLLDQGDPRGEFIHLQCRLARMEEDDPLRPQLETREQELLDHHQDAWLGSLRPLLNCWSFRRGFLDAATVPAATYLGHPTLPLPHTVRRVEVDLDGFEVPQDVAESVPEPVARENVVMPLGFRGRTLVAAIEDPICADTLQKVAFILNRDVEAVAAPGKQIHEAIERAYPGGVEEFAVTSFEWAAVDASLEGFEEVAADAPVVRLVELIISEAGALHADLVRIEPGPDGLHVRYRIDSTMVDRDAIPRRLLGPIVSRIRLLADLRDGNGEQVGRIRGTVRGKAFDLGVVITPEEGGPRVVLTLQSPNTEEGGRP
jgi:uncharacterized protein (TIGR02996 family)